MQNNQATISTSIVQPSKSDETTLDQVEKFKLSIQLIGIKRRCRKSERHFFHFGHRPYNNGGYDRNEIEQFVSDWIATNMKAVNSQVRVSLDHVIIKNEGNFTVTQWEPFSKLNKQFDFIYTAPIAV